MGIEDPTLERPLRRGGWADLARLTAQQPTGSGISRRGEDLMWRRGACFLLVAQLALPMTGSAGEGLVALQTAGASCAAAGGDLYADCENGTVTDTRTGLVWLQNGDCFGAVAFSDALQAVAGLADQAPGSDASGEDCGLADGSSPGDWRIPSVSEFEAMVAAAVALNCAVNGTVVITDDAGNTCWQEGAGNSFTGLQADSYWTSTIRLSDGKPFRMRLFNGNPSAANKSDLWRVWPVRYGQ